jgi:hypothetical protein
MYLPQLYSRALQRMEPSLFLYCSSGLGRLKASVTPADYYTPVKIIDLLFIAKS